MACDQCDALQEQVAYYRSELGLADQATCVHRVRQRFGFTKTEAMIALSLYGAKGRVLATPFLQSELSLPDSEQGSLKTHVRQIRAKMGEDAILTERGVGYCMSIPGLSKILAALDPVEVT